MLTPNRRQFLVSGVAAATAAVAGCTSEGSSTAEPADFGTIAAETPSTEDQPLSPPVAGSPDADVTVMAFEDYACPHCQTYSLEVFPELAIDYLQDGQIRYEFRDFPLPVADPESMQAASAARAVQASAGPQAYFEFAERLFVNQSELGPSLYEEAAQAVDVDPTAVTRAASDQEYQPTTDRDKQFGEDRDVSGTPVVFVDGSRVEWGDAIAYDPVRAAIESALDS
jgi:protein-disulfide isomerase